MNVSIILKPVKEILKESESKGSIENLRTKIIQDMLEILDNENQVLNQDLKNKIEIFYSKIKLLISFISSINNENINQKIKHDLKNKSTIITAIDLLIYTNSKITESYIKTFEYLSKTFLYFIESLYVNSVEKEEASSFRNKFQTDFKLESITNLFINRFSNINLNIDIDNNLIAKGLKGDFYIFLENIIKNSIFRGKAKNIKIYTKQEGENIYLYIADDGTGIDSSKFNNPNDILKLGNSGNGSTGVGLSNLEKRQIKCAVSNEGLKSHFTNIEKIKQENPNFKGKFNPKGTLIKIKLKTQKVK